MSSINFKCLVESLLTESIANDLTPPVTTAGLTRLTFDEVFAKAEKYAFEKGKYELNDTIISFKPDWPYIDVLGYIYFILVNSKVLKLDDEEDREKLKTSLKEANNVNEFLNKLSNSYPSEEYKNELEKRITEKLEELQDIDNYKNFFIRRFKQLNNKTNILAAEEYLNLSPYIGTIQLLKEYGGYDTKIAQNIIFYPGETRFTQQSIIEGPVMATIIEISKLMLVFYREYIVKQKTKTGDLVISKIMTDLQIKDLGQFNQLLKTSAGKLNVNDKAGIALQQDYINFTKGQSKFIVDTNNINHPAIEKIADFRTIPGTSQEIYEAFIDLFNNIRKGTHPNKWEVAGKAVFTGAIGLLQTGAQLAKAAQAFTGHSLYGGVR